MQRVKRLARSIGVSLNAWKLTPTSVLILSGLQCLHERRAFRSGRARIGEAVKLHRSFFHRERFCGEQPSFGPAHPLLELLAAAGDGIELDRAKGQRRCRERAILGWGPVAAVSKRS